jgi:DNA-binding Lrp family transcriptional regulator
MPRRCTVCDHDEHHAINVDLVDRRVSYRTIANRYGLSETALKRHSKEHIPELLLKAYEAIQRDDAEDLAGELVKVKTEVHRLKEKAEEEGDLRTALLGCDKALKALELQAKVEQLIQTQPTVNIALVEHPDYKRLEDIIARALGPYDAARYAVADALRELE